MKLLDAALTMAITEGVDVFDGDFAGWCAHNRISRATAYRHKKRIQEQGRWTPRSHRPATCPHHTPPEVEAEIVRLRRTLGPDNGADTIGYHLARIARDQHWEAEGRTVPCRATIHKILRRHRLVIDAPRKRPRSSWRRFAYARPRDCYQIDATTVRLADGAAAVVFEVLDDCTRTLLAQVAADAETAAGAITAIEAAFTEFGVPAIVLSDNGAAFTSRFTKGGISRFTRHVTAAGARLIHSSPYHPQTCGKVERHHRTFKRWLADRPAPATIAQLQDLCDRYRRFYNTERRHSVWNMPPLQAWHAAPVLGGPEHLPIQHDATVSSVPVSPKGVIRVGWSSVSVGAHRAGQKVTVLRDGDHIVVYDRGGVVLGHLHLDAGKRYQGQLRPAA